MKKKTMSITLAIAAGAVLLAKTVSFGGTVCCGNPPPPCPPNCSPMTPKIPTAPASPTGAAAQRTLGAL